jgi:hypothetical protein
VRQSFYSAATHYSYAGVTGAIGAGASANSEVFQFRWTDTSNIALIQSIEITGMRATTAFAVGTIDIKATIARGWTANGTGGFDVSFVSGDSHVSDNCHLRATMDNSLVTDARIASTAALGAGTKTLDTDDIGQIITHSSAGVGSATPIIGSIYLPHTKLFEADIAKGFYPLVLSANEGFVVRATVPATGVWNIGVRVRWAEALETRF